MIEMDGRTVTIVTNAALVVGDDKQTNQDAVRAGNKRSDSFLTTA
jgi:hypothetical protein